MDSHMISIEFNEVDFLRVKLELNFHDQNEYRWRRIQS
jgi:hypothetical protein